MSNQYHQLPRKPANQQRYDSDACADSNRQIQVGPQNPPIVMYGGFFVF